MSCSVPKLRRGRHGRQNLSQTARSGDAVRPQDVTVNENDTLQTQRKVVRWLLVLTISVCVDFGLATFETSEEILVMRVDSPI